MSVASPVIDYLDLATKHVYLLTGIRAYHPIDDIYKEVRNLRRLNEAYRKFDMPLKAFGAVPKGGGKYTPRYAVFYDGWTIVPEDITHELYISGEQLTEAGESGPACLDLTTLTPGVSVIIHYEPPQAELIEVATSGLTEAESTRLYQTAIVSDLPTPGEIATAVLDENA